MAAIACYDNNEFDQALGAFESIADTSKILFNCGVIHATLGEHEKAVGAVLFYTLGVVTNMNIRWIAISVRSSWIII